jgi:hypothetical protein
VICLDREVLAGVARQLPSKPHQVKEMTSVVNRTEGYGFSLENFHGPDTKPFRVFTCKDLENFSRLPGQIRWS